MPVWKYWARASWVSLQVWLADVLELKFLPVTFKGPEGFGGFLVLIISKPYNRPGATEIQVIILKFLMVNQEPDVLDFNPVIPDGFQEAFYPSELIVGTVL